MIGELSAHCFRGTPLLPLRRPLFAREDFVTNAESSPDLDRLLALMESDSPELVDWPIRPGVRTKFVEDVRASGLDAPVERRILSLGLSALDGSSDLWGRP